MNPNLNFSLMTLVNSVREVSSALQGYKSPPIVNFLQNLEIDTFLQNKETALLEAASLPELNRIVGTSEADFLSRSNESNQQIFGLDGSDILFSLSGNDIHFSGDGDDILNSGYGNDILIAGDGKDETRSNQGDDIIFGGQGLDFLPGGSGSDFLSGGPDDDFIFGNGDFGTNDANGTDILIGDNGDDRLVGEEGSEIIIGGNGDDITFGAIDNDLILGGSGDDRLSGGSENDLVYGEKGNDILTGVTGDDLVDGGIGNDMVFGFSGNDTLLGDQGHDRLIGVDPIFLEFGFGKGDIDFLTGGGDRDTFVLGDADNVYYNDSNSTSTGIEDYALITDFNFSGIDKIQLSGSPTDYFLDASPSGLASGTAIFLGRIDPLAGEPLPELIGIVEEATVQNLDLTNPNQFVFAA